VFDAKSLSIAEIRKENGDVGAESVLVLMIAKTADFFAVGHTMNDEGLLETARLILKEYYFLTMADFQLFFDNFKLGKYGVSYNRLDGNVILVALSTFVSDRIVAAEKLAVEEHKERLDVENKEIYLVKCGNVYVRKTDEGFEEIENKELATPFEFKVAYKLVNHIQKSHYPDGKTHVSLVDCRKSVIKLLDYIKENKPELLSQAQRYHMATDDYFRKRNEILNSPLSPIDQANAIRALSGLLPLSQEEYIQYIQIQNNKPCEK